MNKKIKEIMWYIIIIIVVVLIRSFIITPARVDGESMESTLYNGEIVLFNKIGLKVNGLKRFDIVVFKQEKDLLIKRVIGLPGETVEYINNELYVNYKKVDVPFEFEYTKDFKYQIPTDEYFILGDNRDNSKDSRYFGGIKFKNIKGKVNFILFPFNRIGKVK